MTLISPHCPPRSSYIYLAKMGSGASGLALYWNCLVWVNTSAPFRATLGQGHSWLRLHSYRCSPSAPRKLSRPAGKVRSIRFTLFTLVRGR
jgi:hypothetical protein